MGGTSDSVHISGMRRAFRVTSCIALLIVFIFLHTNALAILLIYQNSRAMLWKEV